LRRMVRVRGEDEKNYGGIVGREVDAAVAGPKYIISFGVDCLANVKFAFFQMPLHLTQKVSFVRIQIL